MASRVISSADFDRYLDRGLAPEQFRYRFLVEGDSWMERSSLVTVSLPEHLARAMDEVGDEVLIVNLARFGDTMRRIGDCVAGEFALWLRTAFNWKFDAILLSVGGNDFIDAALDPGPGLGILKDMAGRQTPVDGADCLNRPAIDRLVLEYLDPNFERLIEQVLASRHAGLPIFLNDYDTPVARDAPAIPGGRAWLFEAYRKNGIAPRDWPSLTEALFAELRQTISAWALEHQAVTVVPTGGVLRPAEPDTGGSSGDWLNEIHPNAAGWRKLALRWRDAIRPVLQTR